MTSLHGKQHPDRRDRLIAAVGLWVALAFAFGLWAGMTIGANDARLLAPMECSGPTQHRR